MRGGNKRRKVRKGIIVSISLAVCLIGVVVVLATQKKSQTQNEADVVTYHNTVRAGQEQKENSMQETSPTGRDMETETQAGIYVAESDTSVLTATEPASEEETPQEPQKTFGDEGVEFVSDDTHYVYQRDENTYFVFTHNGEKVTGYAKYFNCNDEETALKYLDVEKMAGTMFYPEVKDLYARNQYVVTEYNDTLYQGLTIDKLDPMYGDMKLE